MARQYGQQSRCGHCEGIKARRFSGHQCPRRVPAGEWKREGESVVLACWKCSGAVRLSASRVRVTRGGFAFVRGCCPGCRVLQDVELVGFPVAASRRVS